MPFVLFVPINVPFFFKRLFIFERQREAEGELRGAKREGDTESEAGSGLRAVNTQLDMELEPTNCEIVT